MEGEQGGGGAEKCERRNVRDIIRNFERMKEEDVDEVRKKEKHNGNLGSIQKDGKEGGTSGEVQEGNDDSEGESEGLSYVPNIPKPKNIARLLRQHQVTSISLPEESDSVTMTSQNSVTPQTLHTTNVPPAMTTYTAHSNAINHGNQVSSRQQATMTLESGHSSLKDATAAKTVNSKQQQQQSVIDKNGASFTRPSSKPISMISKAHTPQPCVRNSPESNLTVSPIRKTHHADIPASQTNRHSQQMRIDCDLKLNLKTDTEMEQVSTSNSSDELKLLLSPRTKFFVDTASQFRVSFEEEKFDTSEPSSLLRKKLLSSGVGRPRPRSLPPGDLQFFPKSASLDPNWAPRPLRRMMVLHESCAYQFPIESTPQTPCVPQTPLVPMPCHVVETDNSSMESLEGSTNQSCKSKGFKRSISTDSGLSLGAVHQFKVKFCIG